VLAEWWPASSPAIRRFPEVDARVTNQVLDLVAEGIDLAVRISTRRLKDSTLMARRLGPISLQLFAAPSYLSRRGTPRHAARYLDDHDWVRLRGLTQVRLEGPSTVTSTPTGHVVADDVTFILASVVQGAGIGVLPSSTPIPRRRRRAGPGLAASGTSTAAICAGHARRPPPAAQGYGVRGISSSSSESPRLAPAGG
jgi:DNA-binding transcriptional LysR family regulator